MLKAVLQLASNIPAAVVGGGVFAVTLLALNLSIPLALGVGVGAYVVSGLLIFPSQSPEQKRQQAILKTVLNDGARKLTGIRELNKKIKKPEVRRMLETICTVGDNILAAVRKNPETARSAQQFTDYYLDATIKIVQRYIELTGHTTASAEIQASVTKVEQMLGQVQGSFEKQLAHILKDKMLDLDTELSILQETIEIDHL
jgi:5-bromo-4-chloroindolyl phosphate hydrolysis protein